MTDDGIDLVKKFEGCRLESYPDPATGGDPWTIGYGCTGPDVVPGLTITQDEAERRLASMLSVFSEKVKTLIRVDVTPNQFDAIVSLAYNIGTGNLASSTLLRKLNNHDYAGAAAEFPRWNKASGKVMNGLTARRLAEQALFLGSEGAQA